MPLVLHVITELGSGGAQRMLTRLAESQTSFDRVVVSLTDRGLYGAEIEAQGTPVIALGLHRARDLPRAFARLVRTVRRYRPDVVQTWLYHADLLGLLAAKLAHPDARIVWNIRCSDMDMRRYAWTSRALVRLLARLSRWPDTVIVNSRAGQRWHSALGYKPKTWQVLPNGFDTQRLAPDPARRERGRALLGLPDDAVLFVCAARADPMKDHDTLLRAFADLIASVPGARLALLGRGTERLAANRPTDGHVLCLGERHADYLDLLGAADALVLASAFGEGFPNVLGEAMCVGVPCITTDVGDAAGVVGETGWVVPARDQAALTGAMQALSTLPPGARSDLGQRARDRMVREFALPRIVARYDATYAGLLADPPAPRGSSSP